MLRLISAPLLLIVAASSLNAQAPAPRFASPPAGRALDTLYVGSAWIRVTQVSTDSSRWSLVAPDSAAPNGERELGQMSEWRRLSKRDGTLFRVSRFVGAKSEVTDSVLTRLPGLVPISETSHQTAKRMHLHFDGQHVTGDVTPAGKATVGIDHSMIVAPFNSSDLMLLLESIKLDPGYEALVATYEYESGGLRLDTLRVLEPQRITIDGIARDAARVRVSRGSGQWMTVWIDPKTQRPFFREFASEGKGWTIRIVRR